MTYQIIDTTTRGATIIMNLTDLLKSVEIDSIRHNQLQLELDEIDIKKLLITQKK